MIIPWIHKLFTRKRAPKLHKLIFQHAKQITPYLRGSYGPIHKDCIAIGNENSSAELKKVYDRLSREHPEAGKAYWLTRTWDLVCWQPAYIAFISVYGLKSLPDLQNIAQYRYKNFVTGYRFSHSDHCHGEPEVLIPQAAQQLMTLTSFYRQQIELWTRIRPGFTNHLFADLILGCLIKLQKFDTSLSNEYIQEQARLWLEACDLPERHLKSFSVDKTTGLLMLIRTSCCLAYKCDSGKYCSNCPKDKRHKATVVIKRNSVT